MTELTAARLRELLAYDPETGFLIRRFSIGGQKAGSIAGNTSNDGRVQLYVDGKNYKAHRLIWLHVTGAWPVNDVDHRDGNPSNNRWDNLRDVTHQVNQQNRQGPTKTNSTKTIGVTMNRDRYGAQIKIDGKRIWLGTFDTPEEASAVYLEMKRLHHAGCTI